MQKQLANPLKVIILTVLPTLALVACAPIISTLNASVGTPLTIQLQPTKEHPTISKSDIEAVEKVVRSRISDLGIARPSIETIGTDKITLKLAGVKDIQQVARVLGSTAQLEFRQQKLGTEGQLGAEMAVLNEAKAAQTKLKKAKSTDTSEIAKLQVAIDKQYTEIDKLFNKAVITGKQLQNASPQPLSSAAWEVAIEFDRAGGDAFAKMTKSLAGTGRSIGVFLDSEPISTPTVGPTFAETGITGGKAVITGNFTTETANDLAIQLRSGALPVPIKIIENQVISPK